MQISGFLILLTDAFSSFLYVGDWDYAQEIQLTVIQLSGGHCNFKELFPAALV